ncbi:DNA-binding transcriptional regulator, GntR family [Cohaesibacter sp. ES.047]|uniref:GntR family transcriptional regulator n=1 Tax=Cohaesibacter sp. ES.047 TaxID=1798205 RepID=UPI000BB742EA|nr:GntR family transcriptional regulator [Cohaesibacter sp. ES.047]SNY93039.1 DNA-binding transcriptional regulator, GntR family [Cohaesibacter sp. ES.047]
MAQIVRRTTTSIVADELRQRILSGQFKEGEQIKQEAIANELGVSRIPVREAMQMLEAEGLITLVSHKGAVVTRLEIEEIEELFDVRIMLESWLFEHALDHLTEADLIEAEAEVESMKAAKDFQSWGGHNWRFHELLYRTARKKATLKIVQRIHQNIDRYIRLLISSKPEALENIHNELQGLVDLARTKNAETARSCLADHILTTKQELLASIRKS